MKTVLRHLRRAALLDRGDAPSDAHLLESFLRCHDEAAFEGLLRRHGPMVFGVCRRVLGNRADAEDAFQATFLVLVRKAAAIRPRELVGSWLWGVAYRTALKARAMNMRRRTRERLATEMGRSDDSQEDWVSEELLGRLDEALGRLPESYRVPVVLCELEGRSRKEAAGLLGDFEHVECPGFDDKVRFLQGLDVLSVPTTYREPKGLYVLEALANGVPVVQPRHGSFPELIEATGGGLLVNPDDARDLAAALRRLADDPAHRAGLGRKGKEAVHGRFHARAMAEETVKVYRKYVS